MSPYNVHIALFLTVCFLLIKPVSSQTDVTVERSRITETIDGKGYYLHFVKDGETLFSIARAYNTTVNNIFRDNPDSRDGIRTNMILKIPSDKKPEKKQDFEPKIADQPSDEYFFHIVQKQETLFSISRKYGVAIEAIKALNPQTGVYLRDGETLKIPRIKEKHLPDPELQKGMSQHEVEPGETLYSIARKFGIPIGTILNANPGITPETLSIGQVLIIPYFSEIDPEIEANKKPHDKLTEHIVSKGETLYSISRQYAISIDTIQKYNPGLGTSLFIGQKITIPAKSRVEEFIVYIPDRTESLDKIATKYQMETDELSEYNPEIGRRARKGQSIKIPVEAPLETEESLADKYEELIKPDSPCFPSEVMPDKTYNIALMIPLFLETSENIISITERNYSELVNHSSFRFIPFYSGFLMAVDSIKNKGMNVNLFIYDVDDSEKKVNIVLNQSEMSRMDLIVGPLFARSFSRVASFAKNHRIPIVNPLSAREEVIQNNPFVFKLKPSSDVQIDLLVDYILKYYPESNIILFRQSQYHYQAEVAYVRNMLNNRRPNRAGVSNSELIKLMPPRDRKNLFTENKVIDYEKVSRNLTDSTYFSNYVKEATYANDSTLSLRMSLSLARHNLVVAFSEDIVFSKEVLSQLNKLSQSHHITLFGIPDWHTYPDMETSHVLNLNLHSFTSSLVDYKDKNTKQWIEKYRIKYNTEPTESNFAFDGFDSGWYFLNAIFKYGNEFQRCLSHFSIPLIQTRFRFDKHSPNGYRNIYWNLGKFEDYQFKKVSLEWSSDNSGINSGR